MINEDLQKEWDKHLKEFSITMGEPQLFQRASYVLLELSSTISSYSLGIALGNHPPVALPGLYSNFINAYMFSNFVMKSYLCTKGRKEIFQAFVKSELEESKEHLEKIRDLHTRLYRDM